MHHHDIDFHIYAHDTQLYVSFDLSNPNVALGRINLCISDLRIWMIRNKLKINYSKTRVLIITSSFLKQSFNDLNIMVGDSNIVSSNSERNLGLIFGKCINLDYHISSVCKSTYIHLRNIGDIRSILSNDACAQLIHSLITENSKHCCRNFAPPRFSHISATLFDLHCYQLGT